MTRFLANSLKPQVEETRGGDISVTLADRGPGTPAQSGGIYVAYALPAR